MNERDAQTEMDFQRIAALADHINAVVKNHNYERDAVFLTIHRIKAISASAREIHDITVRMR